MKSTDRTLGEIAIFVKNVTYDLIAPTVIGGATWQTPSNARINRSIVHEVTPNPQRNTWVSMGFSLFPTGSQKKVSVSSRAPHTSRCR